MNFGFRYNPRPLFWDHHQKDNSLIFLMERDHTLLGEKDGTSGYESTQRTLPVKIHAFQCTPMYNGNKLGENDIPSRDRRKPPSRVK